MLRSEIQRKMEYMAKGADMYEAGWKSSYKNDYIRQTCEYMGMTPQAMKIKNPGYYAEILLKAGEEAGREWEEEKRLIEKWEEQRRRILESARMA
ncbi:MAG: hypothetical protein IK111_03490 [Lachnospiraceae bacterium]|nr:hypothetical protein [Lachnospiraceae bacterium]